MSGVEEGGCWDDIGDDRGCNLDDTGIDGNTGDSWGGVGDNGDS